MAYSIHITDDHELFAVGLQNILSELEDVQLCGISKNGKDCIYKLRTEPSDILLLDLNLPDMNGTDILDFVVKNKIDTKVIIISMHYDNVYINLAKKRGAHGYVPKNVDKHILFQAIHAVINGSFYFELKKEIQIDRKINLSIRELEILMLIDQGVDSNNIAETLNISVETVKTHRKNILEKNNAKNIIELINQAKKIGLL